MEEILQASEAHWKEAAHEGLPEIVMVGAATVRLVKSASTHVYETALQYMDEIEKATCASCGETIYESALVDEDNED